MGHRQKSNAEILDTKRNKLNLSLVDVPLSQNVMCRVGFGRLWCITVSAPKVLSDIILLAMFHVLCFIFISSFYLFYTGQYRLNVRIMLVMHCA